MASPRMRAASWEAWNPIEFGIHKVHTPMGLAAVHEGLGVVLDGDYAGLEFLFREGLFNFCNYSSLVNLIFHYEKFIPRRFRH
jgi:hypothetical protein